jgi:sterol desaturase/sphingolipid hydroxylase (fatty acid hydroxylase superfamily)
MIAHYMHPVEFCTIGSTVILACVICQTHFVIMLLFISIRQYEAAMHHAGVLLPGIRYLNYLFYKCKYYLYIKPFIVRHIS